MADDPQSAMATEGARPRWTGWFLYPPEGSLRSLPVWVRALNFSAALLLVAVVIVVPFTALGHELELGAGSTSTARSFTRATR